MRDLPHMVKKVSSQDQIDLLIPSHTEVEKLFKAEITFP